MRWPVAVLVGYVLLALQGPLAEALRLGSSGAACPSLVLPFVVFVALFASPAAALWTGLLIGLVVDVSTVRGEQAMVIAGPHALAYLAAALFVVRVRPLVMRKNPLTLAVLSVLCGAGAAVIVAAFFGVRRMLWGDQLGGDLWGRLVGALYTGGAALILWGGFMLLMKFFAFAETGARRPFVRQH